MSKYDFGYELQEGTTNQWAYEQITEECKVLELGSSVGCLTFNLCKNKKCKVDIVEIDAESGIKAAQYADLSLLGDELGNLNSDKWYEKLKDNQYDYIVALDVLEHLENPEKILGCMKELLKNSGKMLLSIPNITHNAIVLELLNNQFTYSELGLLDRTHIHFFSYESIKKMIADNALFITSLDAIKKDIMETEFVNSYKDLPVEVEEYLRTRNKADVYQYLVIIEKEEKEMADFLGNGLAESSAYESKILVNGLSKYQIVHKHHLSDINMDIDIADYQDAENIRFFPVEQSAIIHDLEASVCLENGTEQRIVPNWTSGEMFDEQTIFLPEGRYEVNFLLPLNTKKMHISCKCLLVGDRTENIINCQLKVIHEQEKEIKEKINMINEQKSELQQIKSTWIYKILYWIITTKRKVANLSWKK